jgi:hypothetical protein
MMGNPVRDAIGLALAYVDGNDARLAALVEPYAFEEREMHLLLAVLALVPLDRDGAELERLLWGQALAGASSPS